MLQKSTKNVARELVSCLTGYGFGVLSEIIKQLAQNSYDTKPVEDKDT
jgi:hypothetical protein